jgi:hypothetical protein
MPSSYRHAHFQRLDQAAAPRGCPPFASARASIGLIRSCKTRQCNRAGHHLVRDMKTGVADCRTAKTQKPEDARVRFGAKPAIGFERAARPVWRRHRSVSHRPANGSSWHLRRVDQDREDDPFEPADCRFAGQSRPSRAIHKNAAVGKVLLILDVSLSASILAKRTLSKPCSTIVEYVAVWRLNSGICRRRKATVR